MLPVADQQSALLRMVLPEVTLAFVSVEGLGHMLVSDRCAACSPGAHAGQ
jgi:hypothetical protein